MTGLGNAGAVYEARTYGSVRGMGRRRLTLLDMSFLATIWLIFSVSAESMGPDVSEKFTIST